MSNVQSLQPFDFGHRTLNLGQFFTEQEAACCCLILVEFAPWTLGGTGMGGREMFNHLVESASHKGEFTRKGRFFLGTLIAYAVLFVVAGVASIYAYDAHLEDQSLEYVAFVPPIAPEPPRPTERKAERKAATSGNQERRASERTEFIARVADSTKPPDKISVVGPKTPELPRGDVVLSNRNVEAGSFAGHAGVPGSGAGGGPGAVGNVSTGRIEVPDPPPPPIKKEPATPPKKTIVASQVLNGKAISLPKPAYPQIAVSIRAAGTVAVQVLIDETGKVVSARAVSGPPLLQAAAVKAAYQAKFSPTLLGNQPVKVSGVITYNFTLQQ